MKWQMRIAALVMCGILVCGAGGCSSKPVDIAAELDRGQKYLTEMKYESAIIAFNRVISIDPKNVTANRMLAEAYSQSGKPDEAAAALLTVLSLPEQSEEDRILLAQMIGEMENADQACAAAQMAYSETGEGDFLSLIFRMKGEQKDFAAIERGIEDAKMLGRVEDKLFEALVQSYVDSEDGEAMDQLAQTLKSQEVCEGTVLVLDMWKAYMAEGEDQVVRLLETYYEDEKPIPLLNDDEEVYIGGYDENGKRSGYGICLYGAKVKPDSRIYTGYWAEDERNGDGRAYRSADYRILSRWADDRPEGEVTILQEDVTVEGTLEQGHVVTEMNLYKDGEWASVHCTADPSSESGYTFRTSKMTKPGICHHVEKHSYCWDCYLREE